MQKVRRHPTWGLRPIVGRRFQVLLTPLTGVLFTFPSRYWFTIGRHLVFSLTQWSAQIHTGFHVSRATQELPRSALVFGYGAFTLYGASFQKLLLTVAVPRRGPTTPILQAGLVWAVPLSLAATYGIAFAFYSSAYLDVSVQRVSLRPPMYSVADSSAYTELGFPIRRSPGYSVFAANRGLSQLGTSFIA